MGNYSIEWYSIVLNLLHIAAAYLIALPVAWDRERDARGAGLRTFPLVSVAACGYCLIASKAFAGHPDAQARILQGLMTGVGFIGGGAILKNDGHVRGIATASSIWATGAIGGAVAFARFEIAILISVVTFLTLRFMEPIKDKIDKHGNGNKNENAANDSKRP